MLSEIYCTMYSRSIGYKQSINCYMEIFFRNKNELSFSCHFFKKTTKYWAYWDDHGLLFEQSIYIYETYIYINCESEAQCLMVSKTVEQFFWQLYLLAHACVRRKRILNHDHFMTKLFFCFHLSDFKRKIPK